MMMVMVMVMVVVVVMVVLMVMMLMVMLMMMVMLVMVVVMVVVLMVMMMVSRSVSSECAQSDKRAVDYTGMSRPTSTRSLNTSSVQRKRPGRFFIVSSFYHMSYHVVDLETIKKRLVETIKNRFDMEAGNY